MGLMGLIGPMGLMRPMSRMVEAFFSDERAHRLRGCSTVTKALILHEGAHPQACSHRSLSLQNLFKATVKLARSAAVNGLYSIFTKGFSVLRVSMSSSGMSI
jgi:hypothetical protein